MITVIFGLTCFLGLLLIFNKNKNFEFLRNFCKIFELNFFPLQEDAEHEPITETNCKWGMDGNWINLIWVSGSESEARLVSTAASIVLYFITKSYPTWCREERKLHGVSCIFMYFPFYYFLLPQ